MARSIAVVHGTAITPGVSRNGRLYTVEHIRGAVTRAQTRISEGTATVRDLHHPVSQRTHHAADDDSTAIVGRLTSLTVADDGSARYTAELADTGPARTILDLIDTSDDKPPFLRGVSIRGAWRGEVRRVTHEGRVVETGDGLDIDGLDYTQNPGVTGAVVDRVERLDSSGRPREATEDRHLIYESVEARIDAVQVDEKGAAVLKSGRPAAAPTKAPAGSYADPGYQTDRAKRYPLDTTAHARAAWSYINQAKNARAYTAPQLKRIKGRVKGALRKFGVKIADEGWLVDPVTQVYETGTVASEDYDTPASTAGSYMIRMTNGPTTVTVCSYSVDPADLEVVGHAAMAGAVAAITSLDPDTDGDIDVPGDTEDADDGMETDSVGPVTEDTPTPTPVPAADPVGVGGPVPAPDPAAANQIEEEPAMSEPTTPVEPTPTDPTTPAPATPSPAPATEPEKPATPPAPAGVLLSDAQFASMLAALRAPATVAPPVPVSVETAPPTATTETTPVAEPVAETDDQRLERLVAAGIKAALPGAVQEHVQAHGLPQRRGLMAKRPPVAEADDSPDMGEFGVPADWPQKPLSQYSEAERTKFVAPAVQDYVLGGR